MTRERISGVGKFDLMNALFTGAEITFTVEDQKAPATITAVQAADDSRENWILEGYFRGETDQFKGCYSTASDEGYINID